MLQLPIDFKSSHKDKKLSKKDNAKTKLDLLKTLIVVCLSALFGIVGYTFTHHKALVLGEYVFLGGASFLFILGYLFAWFLV